MFKNKISLITVLLIVIYIVSFPFLNGFSNPFTYDTFGYYLYMPMAFLYSDLGVTDYSLIENLQNTQGISESIYQLNKLDNGNYLNKYPAGLSVLLTPFYLIGHFIAGFTGFSKNGFSFPYQVAITLGCLFYISTSLFILRNLLLRFFSDKIVAITIILICLGTNFLNEVTTNTTMPHGLLFFVYGCIFLVTINWHKNKSIVNSILLGTILGLAVISRPSEIVAVLIPLFWEVKSFSGFKKKIVDNIKFFKNRLLLVLFSFFSVIFIQMLYWKIYGGSFIINTYNNPGEGLDLLNPHIFDFLFSFKKGWIIYTPMVLFSFVGFYFLKRKNSTLFLSFLLYTVFNFYIVSSWTNWWYGHSFGSRAMVQSYVVLAFLLAYFIREISNFKKGFQFISATFIALFLSLNLFQTYQFKLGIIDKDRMTFDYYKSIFLKLDVNKNNLDHLLSIDRSLNFFESQEKYDFEDESILFNFNQDSVLTIKERNEEQFVEEHRIPYYNITNKDYVWMKVSFEAKLTDLNSNIYLVTCMRRRGSGKSYKYQALDLISDKSFMPNEWNKYTVYYLTPHIRRRSDDFHTYFWYKNGGEVFIKNYTISTYRPKN